MFNIIVILLSPVVLFLFFIINAITTHFQRKAREAEKARKEAEKARKEAEEQARIREVERKRRDNISKFRHKFFPIVSPDADIQTVWNHWKSDIHDTDKQLDVQVEALYRTIPILINTKNISGLFIDIPTQIYETTLVSCSCDNFRKYKMPCSHMYRLFYELSNEENRNSKITDIDSVLLSKFYKLDRTGMEHFVETIKYMDDKGRDKFLNENLCKEIDIGLLIKSEVVDYATILTHITKDELILALAKRGIQGFRPSWSKVRLIAWTVENHQEFLRKQFKQYAHVSASQDVLSWGKGIQQSWDIRFESHPYFWREVREQL